VQKWERVQAQLKAKLGVDSYASWFGRCRLETMSKSQLVLSVPTTFLKSWIRTHYCTILLELWQKQSPDILRVDLVVRSAVRSANTENGGMARPVANNPLIEDGTSRTGQAPLATGNAYGRSVQTGRGFADGEPGMVSGVVTGSRMPGADAGPGFAGSPLDPGFTFSSLVEGSSNRMACAAARAVAEADGAAGAQMQACERLDCWMDCPVNGSLAEAPLVSATVTAIAAGNERFAIL